MSDHQGLRSTQDFFAYVITYIERFPDEDKLTPEIAINELIKSVDIALRNCKCQDRRHWVILSQRELEQVRSSLNESKPSLVEKHLRTASEYFDYAVQRKKRTATFCVSPDGQVSILPNRDG